MSRAVLLVLMLCVSGSGDRFPVIGAGSYDGGAGLFLDIEGAATLADGSWYASDKLGYRVYRLSPAGKVTAQAGRRGKQLGEFLGPGAVAARGGAVAVADFAGRRIQRFSAGLRPERLFEAPGPVFDLEFDGAGRLWVASHGKGASGILTCYDSLGRQTASIQPPGAIGDVFSNIFQLALVSGTTLCLAYHTQNRIEVWRTDGSFVRAFSVPGLPLRSPTHPLRGPQGGSLAVPDGNIFRSMSADRAGHILLLGDEYSEHPRRDVYICDEGGALLGAALLPEAATLICCGNGGQLLAINDRRDTVRRYLVHFKTKGG